MKKKKMSSESSAATIVEDAPPVRRLSLNLTGEAYDTLSGAARRKGCSMTELIRWGTSLIIVALEAAREGNKLVIVSRSGEPVKELVLPN